MLHDFNIIGDNNITMFLFGRLYSVLLYWENCFKLCKKLKGSDFFQKYVLQT